ncbi:ABC transporter permease [Kitasatospora sp. NBC_00315]|uniref:ABC transporter permease n=1 Tax=Kitasatospora sp. NBC_00315 TaxID=2975963 RepID=UPI00325420A2
MSTQTTPGTTGTTDGGAAAPAPAKARSSRSRLTMRRFVRNRLALVGLAVLVLLFLAAYLGPLFNKWTYEQHDYLAFTSPPTSGHWFGTTQSGQDLFALTMRGLQKSLVIGLLVGVLATLMAATAGAFSAYFGGWTDRSLMWLVDLLLVMPSFLILAVLSPLFRTSGWLIFVLLISIFSWMITGRVVRSMTLTLKDREFVKAAKYMGVPGPVIIFRHIVPNMASLLIIDSVIQVGAAVVFESTLSYFGFGIQAPDVSLGTVISANESNATTYPWLFFFPAAFLVLIGLAVSFIGDGLRDALDPNSANAKAKWAKEMDQHADLSLAGAPGKASEVLNPS